MSAATCSAPSTIRLFGSIAVEHAGRRLGPRDFGGSRPKQLLEILLAARGRPVPVDRIAELLWGERLPDNFAASIQTFVSTLRRHLCADQHDRIFERFYTHRKNGPPAGGAGLGLAIARAIANDHDGQLTARNETAGGASFTLTLPTAEHTHNRPPASPALTLAPPGQ